MSASVNASKLAEYDGQNHLPKDYIDDVDTLKAMSFFLDRDPQFLHVPLTRSVDEKWLFFIINHAPETDHFLFRHCTRWKL